MLRQLAHAIGAMLVALAISIAPPPAQAADGVTVVPFKVIDHHLYGEVMVGDQGPFLFLFDTGGHDILIPAIAQKAGVEPLEGITVNGGGNDQIEATIGKLPSLTIGGRRLKDQLVIVMPLDRLSPVAGVALTGMIGYESFRDFVVRFDPDEGTLSLIDPARFDPAGAGTELPFTYKDHIPMVQGSLAGIPARFAIDTGARLELKLTSPFVATHALRTKFPRGIETVEGWGVGGPTKGFVTRVDRIAIGPIAIRDVTVSLSAQQSGSFSSDRFDGNIGWGLLKRFVTTIDYPNMRLYLKPAGASLPPEPHDRAGLWVNLDTDGFRIAAVTDNTPAAEAGLTQDMTIVAVDGKPATEIPLGKMRAALREPPPGTRMRLTVRVDGTVRDITLTLRDLI